MKGAAKRVDAGSRGGHNEGGTNSQADLFDSESLQEAADLVEAALRTPEGRTEAAAALLGAASLLEEKLGPDGAHDSGRVSDQDSVLEEWGDDRDCRPGRQEHGEAAARAGGSTTEAPASGSS
jgi:hypothetical protein